MPETQEYRAGFGSPSQLPYGAASELNESLEPITSPGELEAPEPQDVVGAEPEEVEDDSGEEATPADYEPLYVPETEDEEFLTGPTMRPDEDVARGIPSGASAIPASVIRNLPMLQRAAQEPGADPQLQTLVALVLHELSK